MTSAWRSDAGNRVDDRVDGREVSVAGVGRRRADGHEQQARVLERVGDVRREVQALGVLGDQLGKPRLVDRDLALAQAGDLGLVDVDAVDVGAELREARGSDEPHVAGPDHADRFTVHGSGGG